MKKLFFLLFVGMFLSISSMGTNITLTGEETSDARQGHMVYASLHAPYEGGEFMVHEAPDGYRIDYYYFEANSPEGFSLWIADGQLRCSIGENSSGLRESICYITFWAGSNADWTQMTLTITQDTK